MSPESKNNSILDEQRKLASRKHCLLQRARMVQAIRQFFIEQDYLEVETPQLVSELAPEIHIDALCADKRYLHTSPELCMKRLLAAGYPKIFQFSKCFRDGERGNLHLPLALATGGKSTPRLLSYVLCIVGMIILIPVGCYFHVRQTDNV